MKKPYRERNGGERQRIASKNTNPPAMIRKKNAYKRLLKNLSELETSFKTCDPVLKSAISKKIKSKTLEIQILEKILNMNIAVS